MILYQLAVLAFPTVFKAWYDLLEIKVRKKPVDHRSEIEYTFALGAVLSTINSCFLMGHPSLLHLAQSLVLCAGIFVMFFDWTMGYFLHGDILYEGNAQTDQEAKKIGPLWVTLGRILFFALSIYTYTI